MKSTSPHGWSNFATWRVYARVFADFERVFDNFDLRDWLRDANSMTISLPDYMHAVALAHIETHIESALVRDFAQEMFADVNWQELADHVLDAAQHDQQQELDV